MIVDLELNTTPPGPREPLGRLAAETVFVPAAGDWIAHGGQRYQVIEREFICDGVISHGRVVRAVKIVLIVGQHRGVSS